MPVADINNLKTENIKIISKGEYRKVLRKYLPEDAFKPDISHILLYLISLTVFLLGMYFIVHINSLLPRLLVSIPMGIALASLTFFLHDLQHGSIIKSKTLSYITAFSVGLFNFFPPLFWQRVHNLHHALTGAEDDPDRSFIISEKPNTPLEKFMYKTRISSDSFNPILSLMLVSTGFFWYYFGTLAIGLFSKNLDAAGKTKFKRIRSLFKGKFLNLVLLELVGILSFQAFLFLNVAHGNTFTYFSISILPALIAHFIAMMYIHTNHFLSPLTGNIDDPLLNSLSLRDFRISDMIFSNFSYHVEHHLFPAMSSSYYPKVRKLLLTLYPERFQLIPIVDAVKLLFKTPRVYSDYTHLQDLSGNTVSCLLPAVKS